MEKIYMNENNDSNKQKKLDGKYHFSIVLSFVVAAFAIVSLIAVGFNQVSFAAPTGTESGSFVMHFYKTTDSTQPTVVSNGDSNFSVSIMCKSSNEFNDLASCEPVFCIGERDQTADDGGTYVKQNDDVSKEIAYILNRSNINNPNSSIVPKGDLSADHYKALEYYATQVAIWIVLNDSSIITNESYMNDIHKATNYYLAQEGNPTKTKIYDKNIYSYIDTVVSEAQTKSIKSIYVNFADGNSYSAVEGTNYYQTSAITVTGDPSGDLISYELALEGIEGAFLVNDKGEEVKDYKNLSPSDKFYVRFPKDKLANEKKNLKVTVNGTFNYVKPYRYQISTGDQTYQNLVQVENDTLVQSNSEVVELVAPSDTGVSVSKTIYFIGLIVLLCGVGIIYANSKPLKDI